MKEIPCLKKDSTFPYLTPNFVCLPFLNQSSSVEQIESTRTQSNRDRFIIFQTWVLEITYQLITCQVFCFKLFSFRILCVLFPLESKESCYPGWIAVGSSCLRFFVRTRRTWDGARASCRHQGGDLALLNKSNSFTNDLLKLLISLTNSETDFFVGFRRRSVEWRPDIWMWNDGKHIDREQWKRGYPLNGDDTLCGALSMDDMRLLNVDCNHAKGFICESSEGKFMSLKNLK